MEKEKQDIREGDGGRKEGIGVMFNIYLRLYIVHINVYVYKHTHSLDEVTPLGVVMLFPRAIDEQRPPLSSMRNLFVNCLSG